MTIGLFNPVFSGFPESAWSNQSPKSQAKNEYNEYFESAIEAINSQYCGEKVILHVGQKILVDEPDCSWGRDGVGDGVLRKYPRWHEAIIKDFYIEPKPQFEDDWGSHEAKAINASAMSVIANVFIQTTECKSHQDDPCLLSGTYSYPEEVRLIDD